MSAPVIILTISSTLVSAFRPCADDAAAAQDRDAISDAEDVQQVVTDNQDGLALVAQLLDQGHHLMGFPDAERCGRLVEHQNRATFMHGAADRHRLPLTAGEIGDQRVDRGDVDVEEANHLSRLSHHPAAIHHSPFRGLAADEQIVSHVPRADQRQVLIDGRNAEGEQNHPGWRCSPARP